MVPTVAQMRELADDGYQRVRLLSRGIDGKLFIESVIVPQRCVS